MPFGEKIYVDISFFPNDVGFSHSTAKLTHGREGHQRKRKLNLYFEKTNLGFF
jgi:hypothetical protein